MNDIKRIYENIKAHNENLDERIHVLLNSFELERLQAVTEGRYSLLFILCTRQISQNPYPIRLLPS